MIGFDFFLIPAVPVFAVITKIDLIPEKDRRHRLHRIVTELAPALGLLGLEEKILATSLYCNKVTPRNRRSQDIDDKISDLWDMILAPEIYHQETPRKIKMFGKTILKV